MSTDEHGIEWVADHTIPRDEALMLRGNADGSRSVVGRMRFTVDPNGPLVEQVSVVTIRPSTRERMAAAAREHVVRIEAALAHPPVRTTWQEAAVDLVLRGETFVAVDPTREDPTP